ncbi:hypothetical protein RJ639_023904 [Escallonia herrerae]|uniref:Uncharacterized protein n=1 Tax=Escallonia herrerae TaxID=1293975 RepID=A0AA88V1S7_9ASTE|nr:hypothetical protein RJ639_023904 [Escallonia herrerae]
MSKTSLTTQTMLRSLSLEMLYLMKKVHGIGTRHMKVTIYFHFSLCGGVRRRRHRKAHFSSIISSSIHTRAIFTTSSENPPRRTRNLHNIDEETKELVAAFGFSEVDSTENTTQAIEQPINGGPAYSQKETLTIPTSKESLLNSITEIQYVDVGLNCAGAYRTDHDVIDRISKRLAQGASGIRFVFHGTPRPWCNKRRALIRKEKETLARLLKSEDQRSGGKLRICERLCFAGRASSLQMHFEMKD